MSKVGAVPVKGCGVDIIEVKRIARALARPGFCQRIYTPREQDELMEKGAESWAARFAAKEAVMKALGRGFTQGVPFSSVEICSDPWGRPQVRLLEPADRIAAEQGVKGFCLSLSHTKELAVAYVLALGEEETCGS
ncbi:MAG: holo-ACP synthase [Limnochordia bacterium]|jgi:holo-[acyl-carrier protein] synthase|nr:holo-ACP synthase [Bacillota bacterium]HBG10256.1 holo-[acyl-carrier-protein] synthase [Bacillota bacterium]